MNLKRIFSTVFTFCLTALLTMTSANAEGKNTFTPKQTEAIKGIVKDYLLKNPEVIRDAIQELNKRHEATAKEKRKTVLKKLYKEDSLYSIGKGKVTLVEFFDYNCGYCRLVFQSLADLAKEEKGLRIVFIDYPIRSQASMVASQATIAAAEQGKYFELHGALMKVEGAITEDKVFEVAASIGLDVKKLKVDMAKPKVKEAIQRNMKLGTDLGVEGTPAFFIGDQVIPGAQKNLKELLKTYIKEIRSKGCSVC
jgi:protein-disulfide isomerase